MVSRPFRALRNPPTPLSPRSPSRWATTAPQRAMAARTRPTTPAQLYRLALRQERHLSSISESEEDAASQAAAFASSTVSPSPPALHRPPSPSIARSPPRRASCAHLLRQPLPQAACLPRSQPSSQLRRRFCNPPHLRVRHCFVRPGLGRALRSDATRDRRSTTRSRLASDSVLNSSTALSRACLLIQLSASSSLLRAMREVPEPRGRGSVGFRHVGHASLSTPTAPLSPTPGLPAHRTHASFVEGEEVVALRSLGRLQRRDLRRQISCRSRSTQRHTQRQREYDASVNPNNPSSRSRDAV